jgi:integrase
MALHPKARQLARPGRVDDDTVLSYEQATTTAHGKLGTSNSGTAALLTVRQAMADYFNFRRAEGALEQSLRDMRSRTTVHILPMLGNELIGELTAEQLRRWLAGMAASPAQMRPRKGQPRFRPAPVGAEAIRKRRASANRVLTILKAALNHAFDEGGVSNRDAWGRKLKPFKNADAARVAYLTVAQAQRLIHASAATFRPLLRGALETGCRYGELIRLEVRDFNADAGTLAIRQSKSGKPRHVILTESGAKFFRQHCAGLAPGESIFVKADGAAWNKSEQSRPMRAACEQAGITPAVSFHALRHTWASLAVMNGMPLMVVARNLGHVDTRMVERHYGHLAQSYVSETVRKHAPTFDIDG